MKYREIAGQPHSNLFHRLEHEAELEGSPRNGWAMKEFDRVSIHGHHMRFAVTGAAAKFIKSQKAKDLIEQTGWFISVMRDHEEQRGFNEDGSPRMFSFVEVRLEDAKEGATAYGLPATLYHATPVENVSSILSRGLEPREATRPEKHQYPARIHLATSREAAEFISKKLADHDGKEFAMLEVDAAAVEPVYIDPEFKKGGVFTNQPVPSKAIRLAQ